MHMCVPVRARAWRRPGFVWWGSRAAPNHQARPEGGGSPTPKIHYFPLVQKYSSLLIKSCKEFLRFQEHNENIHATYPAPKAICCSTVIINSIQNVFGHGKLYNSKFCSMYRLHITRSASRFTWILPFNWKTKTHFRVMKTLRWIFIEDCVRLGHCLSLLMTSFRIFQRLGPITELLIMKLN